MGTLNTDGLFLKYGTEKATANIGGEYKTYGQLRELSFKITLSALTELETPLSDVLNFPAGARVVDVKVLTTTAAATGTAIDIGLVRMDRSTEIDFNGFLAAFPTAQMDLAGETCHMRQAVTIPVSMTGAGALIGATSGTNPGYVTCSRTTATAFTAGVIEVTIYYYVP